MIKSIEERREEMGLSREELAEQIGAGVTSDRVMRWEKFGFTEEPHTTRGDLLAACIYGALKTDDLTLPEYVPTYPMPGDLIITPRSQEEVMHFVRQAEELNLRIAMFFDYGPDLLSPKVVTAKEINRSEQCYARRNDPDDFVWAMERIFDILGGYTSVRKEGQTIGERAREILHERGLEIDEKNDDK